MGRAGMGRGTETHSQEDLQGTAKSFNVGVVEQAAGDRDNMVVLQGQAGVQDRCHEAAWPVLHPPGAMQGFPSLSHQLNMFRMRSQDF